MYYRRALTRMRWMAEAACPKGRMLHITRFSTAPPAISDVSTKPEEDPDNKHLKKTAQNTRLPVIAPAMVAAIRQESPTVLGLTLKVNNPSFNFKAGQWIDMFIPGIKTVGGFSMYSAPDQLAEEGTIDLGIKFSRWIPAHWVHTQCKVGSQVAIRAGGDFYYDPEIGDHRYDLLLIGGGVGINPLASMFFHANTLHKLHLQNPEEYRPGKVMLLYCARSYEELLYKTQLDTFSAITPDTQVQYYTTRQPPPDPALVTYSHITKEILQSALEFLDRSALKTFICGPPPMIENINEQLLACGLSHHQIFYEKWW